jgi:hypothetical protein
MNQQIVQLFTQSQGGLSGMEDAGEMGDMGEEFGEESASDFGDGGEAKPKGDFGKSLHDKTIRIVV